MNVLAVCGECVDGFYECVSGFGAKVLRFFYECAGGLGECVDSFDECWWI